MAVAQLFLSCLIAGATAAAASSVAALKSDTFAAHIKENKHTLVEFYAPWCGHCKKLEPEFEKAAGALEDKQVKLAKVDATEEKDLATKYNVKGFPTLIWFEDAKETDYDGGRTTEEIVDWVTSMTGPAVIETAAPAEPAKDKPRVVLQGPTLLPGFLDAAKATRRKAAWYFSQDDNKASKVVLQHLGEDPLELTDGPGDKDKISAFVADNTLPLFGKLDGDTFDKYIEAGKGLVWSMFPPIDDSGDFAVIHNKYRPMMSEVANKFKKNYHITITDTEKFKEAIENMLSVSSYPAIAVQKKAGDKKKYVFEGEMTAQNIIRFIEDVEGGRVSPKMKSEAVPEASDDPVKTFVGATLQKDLFTVDKDVLLQVYAPWCGHCKKLDPEYSKLAKKVKKEELDDLLTIAKIDGTSNDSPIESVDWTGFPTLYFAKAGSNEATVYDGERTAKGLWKYIKKHATKAQEIRERIDKRKGGNKKGDEL
jgi:protein disulfide-isomerase/protein disulfide-isomerase A1